MLNLTAIKRAAMGAAALALSTSPTFADKAAEAFIGGILDQANLVFEAETEQDRLDGIADLVDSYVNMDRVAMFVLGQYARQITPEQRAEYVPLFRAYATQIYQDALSEYHGEKLAVTDSKDRSERDIIVNSEILGTKPGDALHDVTVHWRVYRRDGAMSVIDAGAEGVWLAIEQQSQFKSIIANNGGGERGIEALISELKIRTGA